MNFHDSRHEGVKIDLRTPVDVERIERLNSRGDVLKDGVPGEPYDSASALCFSFMSRISVPLALRGIDADGALLSIKPDWRIPVSMHFNLLATKPGTQLKGRVLWLNEVKREFGGTIMDDRCFKVLPQLELLGDKTFQQVNCLMNWVGLCVVEMTLNFGFVLATGEIVVTSLFNFHTMKVMVKGQKLGGYMTDEKSLAEAINDIQMRFLAA